VLWGGVDTVLASPVFPFRVSRLRGKLQRRMCARVDPKLTESHFELTLNPIPFMSGKPERGNME